MKVKTEAKRQAILEAAAEVFREMGFERASMSDIRARAGGSKATLYNYFPSKEKLFFEVMHQSKVAELEGIVAALNPDAEDFKKQLLQFGQEFLSVLYSPEVMAIRHLTIAESRHSEAGKLSFERATDPLETQVAEFLRKGMRRRAIRTADPKVAAIHLLSLLESELLQRFLLGVLGAVEPDTISGAVRGGVDVFLSGYARR
jgi:AcrR family transcriptional regulator